MVKNSIQKYSKITAVILNFEKNIRLKQLAKFKSEPIQHLIYYKTIDCMKFEDCIISLILKFFILTIHQQAKFKLNAAYLMSEDKNFFFRFNKQC